MTSPLLELEGVTRSYKMGKGCVLALRDINLSIQSGEWVAITGPSGSGKSTLMNIIGCLDRPTLGTYRVAARDVKDLSVDDLAALRRRRFGFVFQRYNLLPSLTALANVELPAAYAGGDTADRDRRARGLLKRFNLSDRAGHRPAQLSGGQQQRVSIARALMNGGQIILADEPTGSLDSHSGAEVLSVLHELHAEGHTVIVVTHDPEVAAHAERILSLREGAVVSDRRVSFSLANYSEVPLRRCAPELCRRNQAGIWMALTTAMGALRAHRLRSCLAMLAIMIGIASVASVVALGIGGREKVLNDIRALGTNTLDIYPGRGFGDEKAMSIQTLRPSDALALSDQPYVDAVTPLVSTTASIRFGNVSVSGAVNGVGNQYFRVHPFVVLKGNTFSPGEVRGLAQVAVIDDRAAERLFGAADPIGRTILIGKMPTRVIAVIKPAGTMFGAGSALNVWLPYTSMTARLIGATPLRSITVRVRDDQSIDRATAAVTYLLSRRHGSKDFFFFNIDTIRKSVESATATMTLLLSSIAVISLIVGGIGVMNIMLVSVTERTREIGIRLAVGAEQRDIRQQFLMEAVLVCVIGGTLGVLISLLMGVVVDHLETPIPMAFSSGSIFAALVVSTLTGVGFGYFPARQAARLDPVDALGRE